MKKKYLSITYHWICEAVAMASILIYFGKGVSNLADLFTKVLPVKKGKGYSGWDLSVMRIGET